MHTHFCGLFVSVLTRGPRPHNTKNKKATSNKQIGVLNTYFCIFSKFISTTVAGHMYACRRAWRGVAMRTRIPIFSPPRDAPSCTRTYAPATVVLLSKIYTQLAICHFWPFFFRVDEGAVCTTLEMSSYHRHATPRHARCRRHRSHVVHAIWPAAGSCGRAQDRTLRPDAGGREGGEQKEGQGKGQPQRAQARRASLPRRASQEVRMYVEQSRFGYLLYGYTILNNTRFLCALQRRCLWLYLVTVVQLMYLAAVSC